MRNDAWRIVGGIGAALVIGLGVGLLSQPYPTVDCYQICPVNDWWTALLVFGCWC